MNPTPAAATGTHAFLVVTDSPAGMEFGIDCINYETGPNFRGLSVIPAGLHFVYHSMGMGSRLGQFVFFKKGEIVVRNWDGSTEELSATNNLSEESTRQLKVALVRGDLNNQLGPYPYAHYTQWQNLSNLISLSVLERAGCSPGTPIFPGDSEDLQPLQQQRANHQQQRQPSTQLTPYFPDAARLARFVDLRFYELQAQETQCALHSNDADSKSADLSHALTSLFMDKSSLLETLIAEYFDGSWEELLGEFQLSFTVFVFLYSFPAMEHWKRMLVFLCNCHTWLESSKRGNKCDDHSDFAVAFTRVLYEHLKFCPEDFFQDEATMGSFLEPALSSLFSALSRNRSSLVSEHRKRLLAFAQSRFGLFLDGSQAAWVHRATEDPQCDRKLVEALKRHRMVDEDDLFFAVGDDDMPVIVGFVDDTADHDGHPEDNTYTNMNTSSATVDMAAMNGTTNNISHQVMDVSSCNLPPSVDKHSTKHQAYWHNLDSSFAGIATTQTNSAQVAVTVAASTSGVISFNADVNISAGVSGGVPFTSVPSPTLPPTSSSSSPSFDLPSPAANAMMTTMQREAALYSWRYPTLFEAMQQHRTESHGPSQQQGASSGLSGYDMTMTAARVIDEYRNLVTVTATGTATASASASGEESIHVNESVFANVANERDRMSLTMALQSLVQEARMFLEFESQVGPCPVE